MSVEIQWTDEDPKTGDKRFVRVIKFAREWKFQIRFRRRENWESPPKVTLDMWEVLLDGLERRYQRREGVSEEDLANVKAMVMKLTKKQAETQPTAIYLKTPVNSEASGPVDPEQTSE